MAAFLEALFMVIVIVFLLLVLIPVAALGLWITYRGKDSDEWD